MSRRNPTPPMPSAAPASAFMEQPDSPAAVRSPAWHADELKTEPAKPWRRVVGLALLGVVVVLWVSSSFLQSDLMADGEYSKAYFFTWINTSFFSLPLIPLYLRHLFRKHGPVLAPSLFGPSSPKTHHYHALRHQESHTSLLHSAGDPFPASPAVETGLEPSLLTTTATTAEDPPLSTRETLKLSARFCALWFVANWLNASSFSNTSVASSTILTSTSSVFTLLFGAVAGTERFSVRKLLGVLASLSGIVLISMLDTKGEQSDADRGSFPYKSPAQIAVGDVMALLGAACYGLYATVLTKSVGDERRVNMPLFFGFIGAIALVVLWPGLPLLHLLGVERFALPPTRRVVVVILANASISLVSDVCWAYAVLLTSPLVVTVGLALTIPLSLVGQIVLNGQYSGPWYWVGALVIVLSFVFINYEEKRNPTEARETARAEE